MAERVTDEELAEWERMAEEAELGPWVAVIATDRRFPDDEPWCDGIVAVDGDGQRTEIVKTDCGVYPPDIPTANFIAASREAVPRLIEEVRRLRAEVEELEEREQDRLSVWHAE